MEKLAQVRPIKRSIIANPFILILSGYAFVNLYALYLIAINRSLAVDQRMFDLDIADAGMAGLVLMLIWLCTC
jgi:hypothetical protein